MKQYDVKCPVCGTLNKALYLDETDGWMICEHCNTESCDSAYLNRNVVRLPVYDIKNLPDFLTKASV